MRARDETLRGMAAFRGLTLLEIVVVISVMAALAGLTAAGVIGIVQHARNAASTAILNSLNLANNALFLQKTTEGGGTDYTMRDLIRLVDIRGVERFVATDATLGLEVNGTWQTYRFDSVSSGSTAPGPRVIVEEERPIDGRKARAHHGGKKDKGEGAGNGPKMEHLHVPKG